MIDEAVALSTQLNKYLADKVPVEIIHTNETGDWLWAVQVVGTDFWLDAFKTKRQAEAFCVERKLPYGMNSPAT